MQFKKATKVGCKARVALYGPSGGGKTFTALRIASGIVAAEGGRIAVIDSEHGSASKYADRFDFDTLQLERADIAEYLAAMKAAADSKYVLVVDSMSHAWQELLAEMDRIKNSSRHRGNKWSAWSEGSPKQKMLVDAILSYPSHILATMRSKTEWTTEKEGDKTKPVRVGLAPEQGKGIEYEFDMLIELDADHDGTVVKDRTGKYQDQTIKMPGEDFGRELVAWLSEGEPQAAARGPAPTGPGPGTDSAAPPPPAPLDDIRKRLRDRIFQKCQGEIDSSRDLFHSLCESVLNHKFRNADELNMAQCRMLLEAIEK